MAYCVTRQKKFRGHRTPAQLVSAGAYKASHGTQEQIYLCHASTEACIRREGDDEYMYSLTGGRNEFDGNCSRVEEVEYQVIDRREAHRLSSEHGIRFRVMKTRTIYKCGAVQINVDRVSHLGDFVEIRAECDEEIERWAEILCLDPSDLEDASYYEMMQNHSMSVVEQSIVRRYDDTQAMTFGIVSGILTAVGIIAGVSGDDASAKMIIKVLLALAFADSCSDALGQFRAEWTKWDSDLRASIRVGLSTLVGKMVMPLTFIFWFAVLPLRYAFWVSFGWALLLLGLHALAEATARERPRMLHPLIILGLSTAAVVLTKAVTMLLDMFYV